MCEASITSGRRSTSTMYIESSWPPALWEFAPLLCHSVQLRNSPLSQVEMSSAAGTERSIRRASTLPLCPAHKSVSFTGVSARGRGPPKGLVGQPPVIGRQHNRTICSMGMVGEIERAQRASLPVTGVGVHLIHGPGAERNLARLIQVLVHEPFAAGPSRWQREIDPRVSGTSSCAGSIWIGQEIGPGSEGARLREGNRNTRNDRIRQN